MPDETIPQAPPEVSPDEFAAEVADNGTAEPAEQAMALEGLWSLLERLVPEDKNEVVDVFGEIHTIATTISARKQIGVFREIRKLLAIDIDIEKKEAIAAAFNGENLIAGLGEMLEVVGDENVLGHFDRAFQLAFPILIEKLATDELKRPTDLFALEEIISALLPFFIRAVRRPMKMMKVLGET